MKLGGCACSLSRNAGAFLYSDESHWLTLAFAAWVVVMKNEKSNKVWYLLDAPGGIRMLA